MGQINLLLTDKTGTLTTGKMNLKAIFGEGRIYNFDYETKNTAENSESSPKQTIDRISVQLFKQDLVKNDLLHQLCLCICLCNSATTVIDPKTNQLSF